MEEERLVKFETPWSERISNWNKFKPFASWYHHNKNELWRYGGSGNFKLKMFMLYKVPSTYKKILGVKIRDPQRATKKAVITSIYVRLGHEEVAKAAIRRLGYSKIRKEKTYLWKAMI